MSNKSRLQFPNKKQFTITVPKSLVEAKGWKQGDVLEFSIDESGNLHLKRGDDD